MSWISAWGRAGGECEGERTSKGQGCQGWARVGGKDQGKEYPTTKGATVLLLRFCSFHSSTRLSASFVPLDLFQLHSGKELGILFFKKGASSGCCM